MGVILKNNATSTITTTISASDVGLAVAAGTGSLFPTLSTGDYFYATLVSSGGTYEVIKVTARVGDTMTIVRAQEGTTAQSFASGSRIELRVTAQSVIDAIDGASTVATVSDITALRAETWPAGRPLLISLVSNWTIGDGGGTFRWDASSTAADNSNTIIKETATITGRWILQRSPEQVTQAREVTARKEWYNTAFFSPLQTIPGSLGSGDGPALQNSSGLQALNEAWVRSHVQMLVNELGIKRIVIAQLEFGGYHWLMPPSGQVWPDRLSPSTGKPVWYWTLIAGDTSAYIDIDLVDIVVGECERLGASVVFGTSRNDDFELLNDDANTRIGLRPVSTLTLSSAAVGTRTITADLSTFLVGYIGRIITPETGAGSATITGFTSGTSITVDVTEAFGSTTLTPDNWRLKLADPVRYGLTMSARMTRAVDFTRQLASWVVARWGSSRAFRGFYSAHEPDSLEGSSEFFGRVWSGAGTYPALSTYSTVDGQRIEWWMSPASPIDNFYTNIARIRTALITAGVSHLSEQDSVGAGVNRLTGVAGWIAGQSTTLDQLYASHVAYRAILAGTGIEFVGHAEVWEMAGPAYDKPYPGDPTRLASQWAYGQALTHSSSLYQTVAYLARPTDPIQPPVSTSGSASWRTRAHALYNGLVTEYRDRTRRALAYAPAQVQAVNGSTAWTVFGGAFTTTISTVTPTARSSVMEIEVSLKLNRTGAAGGATGYVDCSIVVDGVEFGGAGGRVRAMQDDARADGVVLRATTRAVNSALTIQVRIDNQLFAPTSPTATAVFTIKEMVG
jgi:hypothetical protein